MKDEINPIKSPDIVGSKTVYPRPLPDAYLLTRHEMATLSLVKADRLWAKRVRQQAWRNPVRIASLGLWVAAVGIDIYSFRFTGTPNFYVVIRIVWLALGLSFLLGVGSALLDIKYRRYKPRVLVRRAEIPETTIDLVGEPSDGALVAFAAIVCPVSRKRLLDEPFESGQYESWVARVGAVKAAKRYWRKIRVQCLVASCKETFDNGRPFKFR